MAALLELVNRTWGKACSDGKCAGIPKYKCGGCDKVLYCGEACQIQHWGENHRYECIAGKPGEEKRPAAVKRTEREEEMEEPEPERKRHEDDPSGLIQIDVTEKLSRDAWSRIIHYLDADDIRALKGVSRDMLQKIRAASLDRFRLRFSSFFDFHSLDDIPESLRGIRAISFPTDMNDEMINRILKAFFERDPGQIIDLITKTLLFEIQYVPNLQHLSIVSIQADEYLILKKFPQLTHFITGGSSVNIGAILQTVDLTYIKVARVHFIQTPIILSRPSPLRTLILGEYFNVPIDLTGFPNLEHLSLGNEFNQELSLEHVPLLRHLELGNAFNQSLDLRHVPKLRHLNVGNAFDQELDMRELIHLNELRFGHAFNRPLYFPPTLDELEFLSFGFNFNQPVDLLIMPNLRYLKFGRRFDHVLDFSNNVRLVSLNFTEWSDFNSQMIFSRPLDQLRVITFGHKFNRPLPLQWFPHLEQLKFYNDSEFDQPLVLEWSDFNSQMIFSRPLDQLRVITFGHKFNRPLPLQWFPNLEQLKFYNDSEFDQPLVLQFVPRLQQLNLGSVFNQPLALQFVRDLRELTVGARFNQPLDFEFTPKLSSLTFGSRDAHEKAVYDQPLDLRPLVNLKHIVIWIAPRRGNMEITVTKAQGEKLFSNHPRRRQINLYITDRGMCVVCQQIH